jgi:glycosyltransferase involved in cell wall biosynthesis
MNKMMGTSLGSTSESPGCTPYESAEKPEGITIVVVSYRRMQALRYLLAGLLTQDMQNIQWELILVNNSSQVNLKPSLFSRIGRLLRRFPQVRVLNSSYNWGPGIRYALATAAQYKTILFIDDDIYPVHPQFLARMYSAFRKLNPVDILTCWADLWVEWDDNHLSTVSMGFLTPEINELTEVDYCGTGISMLNKRVLLCPEMLDISPEYKFADTAWFPWIPNIVYGSRKFYFPSFDMLKYHKEKKRGALCQKDGYEKFIFSARKSMLNLGYQPVLGRSEPQQLDQGSPEQRAIQILPIVTRPW